MSHNNEDDKTIFASDSFIGKVKQNKTPPCIVVLIGPPSVIGKQYLLMNDETIIGRSVDCGIYIDDRSLSRHHARFNLVEQSVTVVDMGSTNKTIVSGTSLAPLTPHILKPNDQIKLGNVVLKYLEAGSIEASTTKEMQDRATKDALTGAYTKGDLYSRGPEIVKRAEALKEPLSMIVFDIDFFKKINDTYNHAGGDYVLKELAQMISNNVVRSQDYFVRYGGEEFVIILLGGNLKQGYEIAERIRTTVQAHPFNYEGQSFQVTVSLGVAEKLPNENTWEQIFDRADKAAYQSKKTGRNRVTVATS